MRPTIIEGAQRSDEWFVARMGIPTGSGFAHVMAKGTSGEESLTRRDYATAKALELVNGKPSGESSFVSWDIRNGIEREPLAIEAYQLETGVSISRPMFVRNNELRAGVSPDFLVGDDGGGEVKCPKQSTHMRYLELSDVPPEYKWQVHGSMLCTGRAWWDFISWNPDFPPDLQLHIVRVHRNEELIQQLEVGIFRFHRYVASIVENIRGLQQRRKAHHGIA